MEPEDSLPCSQEPSTGPNPEPDQSNPYHPIGPHRKRKKEWINRQQGDLISMLQFFFQNKESRIKIEFSPYLYDNVDISLLQSQEWKW
jgi:hypothetical protein